MLEGSLAGIVNLKPVYPFWYVGTPGPATSAWVAQVGGSGGQQRVAHRDEFNVLLGTDLMVSWRALLFGAGRCGSKSGSSVATLLASRAAAGKLIGE
jgi:hypothetical protein